MSVRIGDMGAPPIQLAKPVQQPAVTGESRAAETTSFSDHLTKFVGEVNQMQTDATNAANDFAAGKQNDIHGTMIHLQEADITFRLLANVRNRALEAYREIMRMSG